LGSVFEDNHDVGVLVSGSNAALANVLVHRTSPRAADALYGDGIVVVPELAEASLNVVSSRIDASARAGLAIFGSPTWLRESTLGCNQIDLDVEQHLSQPPQLNDEGGNTCGCAEERWPCTARSSNLDPPVPLDD
jgi:hypothetical protein